MRCRKASPAHTPLAMRSRGRLELTALRGIPLVQPGDDLSELVSDALAQSGVRLETGDILAVAQKIVSKSENRYVDLATVTPSDEARALAAQVDKDPRLVHVVLSESSAVLRTRPGLLVVAHRLGMVLANAGVDRSNIEQPKNEVDDVGNVLLWPVDPDASAARLRAALRARFGVDVGVVITDTVGRPFRCGVVGVAIGVAGVAALWDLRGAPDLFGNPLRVTEVAHADELAAAASILMGQAAEATPVVLIRGDSVPGDETTAASLVRSPELDLFR